VRLFSASAVPHEASGAWAALGNLDGVHLGHQAVLAAARARAKAAGLTAAAAVFEPHPRRFFQPQAAPFRLQSNHQRARALMAAGAEIVFEVPFDADLAAMNDADFCRVILKERLGVAGVAVGFDFCYGKNRMGDAASLARHGAALGFAAVIVDAVDDAAHPDHKVSSSAIRAAIAEGDMAEAARLLGRPWAIEGTVIHGFQRGRTIQFPTANIDLADYARPAFGVYAVRADLGDGVWRAGVANCGVKPTVAGDAAPLLEAHLFDFEGDLYGRMIEVRLLHFLRPERKFENFAALSAQITTDAQHAQARLTAETANAAP
jgi:riboflavin kinase / FMN adenylyltransferase